MAKARQMATPGRKVADKPDYRGLMVDFYLKGGLLILPLARPGRTRGFLRNPARRLCPARGNLGVKCWYGPW